MMKRFIIFIFLIFPISTYALHLYTDTVRIDSFLKLPKLGATPGVMKVVSGGVVSSGGTLTGMSNIETDTLKVWTHSQDTTNKNAVLKTDASGWHTKCTHLLDTNYDSLAKARISDSIHKVKIDSAALADSSKKYDNRYLGIHASADSADTILRVDNRYALKLHGITTGYMPYASSSSAWEKTLLYYDPPNASFVFKTSFVSGVGTFYTVNGNTIAGGQYGMTPGMQILKINAPHGLLLNSLNGGPVLVGTDIAPDTPAYKFHIQYPSRFRDSIRLDTVKDLGYTATNFLTRDTNNTLKSRTVAEVLSDIGALPLHASADSAGTADSAIKITKRTIGNTVFDATANIISDTANKCNHATAADSAAKLKNNPTLKYPIVDSMSFETAAFAQTLWLYKGTGAGTLYKYGFGIQSGELRTFYGSDVDNHIAFGYINKTDGVTWSEVARINTVGMGIGTGASILTGYKFDVNGKSNFQDTTRHTNIIATGNIKSANDSTGTSIIDSLNVHGTVIKKNGSVVITGSGATALTVGSGGIAGVATPTRLYFDGTYANTATPSNQQLKLNLVPVSGTEGYGFAVGNDGSLWYHSGANGSTTTSHNFAVGGTSQLKITGTGAVFTNAFGCNGATAQAKKTVPAAVVPVSTTASTQLTPWGFATQGQADSLSLKINQLTTLVDSLRAALVNNGIAQ